MTSAVPAGANAEAHADRTRRLLAYLVTLCSERGALQVAPTNAQLCADLKICRRNIVHAFRELEAHGLGKRSGGAVAHGITSRMVYVPAPYTERRPKPGRPHAWRIVVDTARRDVVPLAADGLAEPCLEAYMTAFTVYDQRGQPLEPDLRLPLWQERFQQLDLAPQTGDARAVARVQVLHAATRQFCMIVAGSQTYQVDTSPTAGMRPPLRLPCGRQFGMYARRDLLPIDPRASAARILATPTTVYRSVCIQPVLQG